MKHSHTFRYEDCADLIHQLEETKQKLLSSAEQEDMIEVRNRYGMKPSQFSMRIARFKGDFACTRIGGRIETIFITRELHEHLSK